MQHLLHIRPRDRLDTAQHRVRDHDQAHERRRESIRPAEDHREHDRRRVDRQPRREAALHQEDEARRARASCVEALLQILVRRVDVRAVKDGHRGRADDHHRDRQSEIELHEAHAVDVGLPGGGDEGDGAGLRGHDRERHGVPRHRFAGQQVAIDCVAAAAAIQPVRNDEGERRGQDNPVERPHRYALVNA